MTPQEKLIVKKRVAEYPSSDLPILKENNKDNAIVVSIIDDEITNRKNGIKRIIPITEAMSK